MQQLCRALRAGIAGGAPFTAAASSGGIASLDETRSVIKLAGANLIPFLQRVVSSDVSRLVPGAPPVYACVLTPQGRLAHDLFLHAAEGSEVPSVLVDCDASQRRALMDLLQRYSLHHKVDVSSAGRSYTVMAAFGGGLAGASSAPERAWPADPRLRPLGRRAILPRGSAPAPTASWKDYAAWRIGQGVAEGSEMPSGEANPLECNLDTLHGVSFDKGCYIGQEFVARIHARGVVRKRIMPFRLGAARGATCLSSVNLDPRSSHVFALFDADESLHPVGRVRAVQGGVGLAKIRLTEAMAAIREERPLLVGHLEAGTAYAEVWPWRPDWWEPGWGYEEHSEAEEELQRRTA